MKIAVITIVKNEEFFLPFWYDYYKKHIPEADIFIYDNDSEQKPDKSIPLHSEYNFDHVWLRQTAYKLMAYHLLFYDYVLCIDADEILMPDPRKYKNIIDYVVKNPKEILHATGYEVVGKKNDPPIDFSKGIFEQRHYWTKLSTFYKPVLSTVPIKKMYTNYTCASIADPDLYLIHLNRIDYKTSYDKYQREKTYEWNPHDLKYTDGWQHRITNDAAFDEYYLKIKTSHGKVGPIPDWVKNGFKLLR